MAVSSFPYGASSAQEGNTTWGSSAIPDLSDITAAFTVARTGARWSSDGDVYTREATTTWTSIGTWIGNKANTAYEGRWVKSNDVGTNTSPRTSSGTDGVWHDMSTDVMVANDTPADDTQYDADFSFELRVKANPGTTVITDTFNMYTEEFADI